MTLKTISGWEEELRKNLFDWWQTKKVYPINEIRIKLLEDFIRSLFKSRSKELREKIEGMNKDFHYTKGKVRCYKCDFDIACKGFLDLLGKKNEL